jgi:transposase-like protein
MSNKYVSRLKTSEAKFRQVVKLFAADLDASQIAAVTGLNRNTMNRYLMAIRQRIAQVCQQESLVAGEIGIEESDFGPRRVH